MAGSVVRNNEVVQEGDGQTTSETGWDHRSQMHKNGTGTRTMENNGVAEPSHRPSAMKMI